MEYRKEFETRKDVKKVPVSNGRTLYFVPDGTGKYEFCSKDADLQKWCESTKNKKVKENALRFVSNAACEYLKGKTQLRDTSASVTANWKDNPVGTLQNVLQASGKMPKYSEPEEGYLGGIVITLSVDGYEDITKSAQNQKEARKACAIAFAEENLGIDVEKEAQKVTETPKPQQTQQKQQPQTTKLPQTFAVSPDKCGDWNRDAVSALQIFCQKNKIAVPQYFNRGTSQGYVTQTTMTLKWGDVEVTKSAATKQEAKNECARAFRKDVLEAPRSKEKVENVSIEKEKQKKSEVGKLAEKTSAQAGFYLIGKNGTKKTFYAVNDSGEVYKLSPKGKLHTIGKSLWIDEEEMKKGEIFTIYENNDKIAAFGYKGTKAALGYASDDLRLASDNKYCYAPFYEDANGLVSKAEFSKIVGQVLGNDRGNFVFANIESFEEMENPNRYGKRRQATAEEITNTAEAIFDLAKEDIEYYAREDRIERSGTHYRAGFEIDAEIHEDNVKEIRERILSDDDLKLPFHHNQAEQVRKQLKQQQQQPQQEVKNFDPKLELLRKKFNGGRYDK